MGIRSDVILCIENEVYKSLSDESKETIRDWLGVYVDRAEEGMIFEEDGLKWYHDMSPELMALYEDLDNKDADGAGYLIIAACSEYPSDTEGDVGAWDDNPWDAHRVVSVTAEWHLS